MIGAAPPGARRPRLWGSIVRAPGLVIEHAFPLVAANLLWGALVAAFVALVVGVPLVSVALPLLALPTAALTRLSVAAVRSGIPSLRMARDELGRLPVRKVMLAAAQALVLIISLTNIGLAGEMGGWQGLLSGGVAIYAVIVSGVYAMALWPIVCDPARASPLRDQLRLALAVSIRRPLQLGILALIAGLTAVASTQVLVLAFFLPVMLLLAITGYVVPAADEIAAPSEV